MQTTRQQRHHSIRAAAQSIDTSSTIDIDLDVCNSVEDAARLHVVCARRVVHGIMQRDDLDDHSDSDQARRLVDWPTDDARWARVPPRTPES